MIYKYFDEMKIGEKNVSRARTVTEADVVLFCMFTGNWLELHSNAQFAETTRFGQRLVQGSLVYSLIPGLFSVQPAGRTIAFYGVDKLRFVKPVFIGDTVRVEAEVIDLHDRGESDGIVTQSVTVKNQRDETVQVSVWKHLVAKSERGR